MREREIRLVTRTTGHAVEVFERERERERLQRLSTPTLQHSGAEAATLQALPSRFIFLCDERTAGL